MARNIEIKIWLGSPLCVDDASKITDMALDSIAGYVSMLNRGYDKCEEDADRVWPELPFVATGKCYHASCMFIPKEAQMSRVSFAKTTRYVDEMSKYGFGNLRFNASSGWARAATVTYWIISTPYIKFYAEVTDFDKFVELMKGIKELGFIGKKHDIGFGLITKIDLADAEENLALMDSNNFPTRRLPVKLFKDKVNPKSRIGLTTYYAPYWVGQNSEECYLPSFGQCLPYGSDEDINIVRQTLAKRKKHILEMLEKKKTKTKAKKHEEA